MNKTKQIQSFIADNRQPVIFVKNDYKMIVPDDWIKEVTWMLAFCQSHVSLNEFDTYGITYQFRNSHNYYEFTDLLEKSKIKYRTL